MTTKKLSEIGNTRSRHPVDGGMVPYDPKLKNHIVILTEAERRELVREVWNSSRNELAAEHANLGRALTFEEFLEEQGI